MATLNRITRMLLGLVFLACLTASQAFGEDLLAQQWRLYSRVFTSQLWAITKASNDGGVVTFPISQYDTQTTGSFAVYLMNNYNRDLTGRTIKAQAYWTEGTYDTRSILADGRFRIWFQDVTSGPYTMNDYWWCADFDAMTAVQDAVPATYGKLQQCSLADRTLWTNMCGKSATDTTQNYSDCMSGTPLAESPYAGFTRAAKAVKQLGLSFGNQSAYASGVALEGGPGEFTLTTFEIIGP